MCRSSNYPALPKAHCCGLADTGKSQPEIDFGELSRGVAFAALGSKTCSKSPFDELRVISRRPPKRKVVFERPLCEGAKCKAKSAGK
jgi:hypothetical protein